MTSSAERTLILFAHGAGAGVGSAWMQAWAGRLGALGQVVPFEYPYMQAGRRSPDRLPKLIAAHREALAEARASFPGRDRVFLCGKSMGSRVGCHAALEPDVRDQVAGLVCLGYPLKGVGSKAALRDEVLVALERPILFVQGTRDKLCPLDLLAEVRGRMRAPNELFVVEDGDHSLVVAKRTLKARGLDQAAADAEALAAVARWMALQQPASNE